jgi:hypothetical protein
MRTQLFHLDHPDSVRWAVVVTAMHDTLAFGQDARLLQHWPPIPTLLATRMPSGISWFVPRLAGEPFISAL